jgi:hypothetical protein
MNGTAEETRAPVIFWDASRGQWACRIGGPGRPVLYCKSKAVLEQMLDHIENTQRERSPAGAGRGGASADGFAGCGCAAADTPKPGRRKANGPLSRNALS